MIFERVKRWSIIPSLYLLGFLGIVASIARLGMTIENLPQPALDLDWVDQRYADHPWLTILHILPGLIFLLIGPLQFSATLRRKAITLHRWLGRTFIISGLLSALSVMWIVLVFPAMGGSVTIIASWLFAILMIWALFEAYRSIRARNISRHRAFMIRAFAIGLAVSTIRLVAILADVLLGIDFVDFFGWSVMAGFVLNSLVAEWVIRRSQPLPN